MRHVRWVQNVVKQFGFYLHTDNLVFVVAEIRHTNGCKYERNCLYLFLLYT